MKNPEVKQALSGNSTNEELEALLEDMDIGADDTIESVAKKSSAKMKKLVKYFTTEMAKVKTDAVNEATEDTRKREDAKIKKFATDNPGMKNPEVVAMMQQLYDNGKSLKEAYATACKGLDLDPVTGEAPKEETAEEKEAKVKKEKAAEKKAAGAKQSIKSGMADDDDGGGEDADDKDAKPMSLDEALASASSAYIAKNGNPFEKKET